MSDYDELRSLAQHYKDTNQPEKYKQALIKLDAIPFQDLSVPENVESQQPAPQNTQQPSTVENIESMIPNWVSEGAAAMNRPVLEFLDFLGPDTANAILSLSGSETRVPTLMDNVQGAQGNFMEDGLAKDIVRGAGETATIAATGGAGIRNLASKAPEFGATVGQNVLKQVAATTPTADIALGAASGAGAAIGKDLGGDIGAMAGSILAPLSFSAGSATLKQILNLGGQGIGNLTKSLSELSDEGAAKLLAERMVREGLTPDDVAKKLTELGPNAMPADLGANFVSLLKRASNEIPAITALAGQQLTKRQAGQAGRIAQTLDDSTGTPLLTVDDELKRLEIALKPQISKAYDDAKIKGEKVLFPEKEKLPAGVGAAQGKGKTKNPVTKKMTRLEKLINGDQVTASGAKKAAESELSAKQLSGETVTKLDIVDAHKRALDDIVGKYIRTGENNKARNFLNIKNMLVKEADDLVPEYKQARDIFAGKAELENAAELGGQYLKLKPREILAAIKTMGESEKKFFKLGAKQAILDKVDTMQISSDAVKRLFKKNGDAEKLKPLFESDAAYKKFVTAMEKEANYSMTKRAAMGGSSTTKQLSDSKVSGLDAETLSAMQGNPISILQKIGSVFGKLSTNKNGQAYKDGLEQAGRLLLEQGVDAKKIIPVLQRGRREEVQNIMKMAFGKKDKRGVIRPTIQAGASSLMTPERNQ